MGKNEPIQVDLVLAVKQLEENPHLVESMKRLMAPQIMEIQCRELAREIHNSIVVKYLTIEGIENIIKDYFNVK